MNNEIFSAIYWPTLSLLCVAKPISDVFWVDLFEEKENPIVAFKALITTLCTFRYMSMILVALLLWAATYIYIENISTTNGASEVLVVLILTMMYCLITVVQLRSILVVGIVIVTFANFSLVQLFLPLTKVSSLPTLNSFLTNLITTFNYAAIATAAIGLVWKYGQDVRKENVYGTISTMFYALCFILFNMLISFVYLFIPTVNRIVELA